MNIVVLTGGISTERDVSISTAIGVSEALRSKGHKAILVDVFLGCPHITDYNNVFDRLDTFPYTLSLPGDNLPDIENIKKMRTGSDNYLGKGVIDICKIADFVFIACLGGNCENGRIQAVFDCYNIKYSGSGYVGSALAMNKIITVQILRQSGVNVAESVEIRNSCKTDISYPVVIKAQNQGSSVGIFVAHNDIEYYEMVKKAFIYDDIILVEKFIHGNFFTVGIVGNTVLPVLEVKHDTEIFGWNEKYKTGLVEKICPASISKELTKKLQDDTVRVYDSLFLSGYARIDFMADENENIFCLEANTVPALAPTSSLPKAAIAYGWSYEDLCENIIESSMEKKFIL